MLPLKNYVASEKLCLALYFTCTKLRAYLRPVTVHLISKVNLVKYMFSHPILHQRVGLWTLALLEFEIQYIPQKTIKNQVLANFLADHPCFDMPEEIELEINSFELKPWVLYFDGSKTSKGAGVGVALINPLGICYKFAFSLDRMCTNNQAEYKALIVGLELMIDMGVNNVIIRGDSQLVIHQLIGDFKCQNDSIIS